VWSCEGRQIAIRVHCSSGTYVRTLAESIAERLGTVGHVAKLVRLHIGSWSLDRAIPLAWIEQTDAASLTERLQPVLIEPLAQPHAYPPRA
jgi:tRNA pseudouridine55 synthase